MPSLFDHLSAHVGGDDPGGITPLDIADLPADQRQVMLSLLREQAGTTDGVAIEFLNTKFAGKITDIESVLEHLVRDGWLIVFGEKPNLHYRVNLRAKRGSNASFGLWSVLSDRISKDRPG
ncbi:MAG: hypothetical protein UZ15_CFX003002339 [Chloroflexi bacterium OLB15]|nr:MAG: hypothetical protein UZ15_CFX003002339 [Chloroflexi bacterium OLB15]